MQDPVTGGRSSLVNALRIITVQTEVAVVGVFSIFEARYQDQLWSRSVRRDAVTNPRSAWSPMQSLTILDCGELTETAARLFEQKPRSKEPTPLGRYLTRWNACHSSKTSTYIHPRLKSALP